MNSNLFIKIIGGFVPAVTDANIVPNWVSFSVFKSLVNIQAFQLFTEEFMSFLLKIIIISIVTAVSLFIGGWIASRMIKMDNRNNLIDW